MTRRRGGYVGNRIHVLKFRADPDLDARIRQLAEARQVTMASVVRELVERAVSRENTSPPWTTRGNQ
jgi:predicted transcriptional regulator